MKRLDLILGDLSPTDVATARKADRAQFSGSFRKPRFSGTTEITYCRQADFRGPISSVSSLAILFQLTKGVGQRPIFAVSDNPDLDERLATLDILMAPNQFRDALAFRTHAMVESGEERQ